MSSVHGKQIKNKSIKKEKLDFDLSFKFTQPFPTNVWNVTHTLDKYTNVTIYDDNDIVIEGEIIYISSSQLQLSFNTPTAGTVIIS